MRARRKDVHANPAGFPRERAAGIERKIMFATLRTDYAKTDRQVACNVAPFRARTQ